MLKAKSKHSKSWMRIKFERITARHYNYKDYTIRERRKPADDTCGLLCLSTITITNPLGKKVFTTEGGWISAKRWFAERDI